MTSTQNIWFSVCLWNTCTHTLIPDGRNTLTDFYSIQIIWMNRQKTWLQFIPTRGSYCSSSSTLHTSIKSTLFKKSVIVNDFAFQTSLKVAVFKNQVWQLKMDSSQCGKDRRRAKGGLAIYGMGVPLNSHLKKKLDTSVFCSSKYGQTIESAFFLLLLELQQFVCWSVNPTFYVHSFFSTSLPIWIYNISP